MFEVQTKQSRIDEANRCRDWSWLANAHENRHPVDGAEFEQERLRSEPEAGTRQAGLLQKGQNVFLSGDQFVGKTTKLFYNLKGEVNYFAVRTARLFGRHKMIPVRWIGEVTSSRIMLSINRDQFLKLPGYRDDVAIFEEAGRALWNDIVLRDTDLDQIDIRVTDGVVMLNGHVITSMNQWRAVSAVENVPGVLGVKSYLVPDDQLVLKVAMALGEIEEREDCKFFTKVVNGIVLLSGKVSSLALREQAEQCVAEIPWVRGIVNEIDAPGIEEDIESRRFLQPIIGNKIVFKDGVSATIHKVVINPHNRRVTEVVLVSLLSNVLNQDPNAGNDGKRLDERLIVISVGLIKFLTQSGGIIRIDSSDTAQYEDYNVLRYVHPDMDWLPPYPYCPTEVLFQVEK